MEHEKLSALLRILPANAAVRSPDCPDNHELAASVDGQLPADINRQLAFHLADCGFCTAQVGLLKRLSESEPEQQVTEFVLARARRLGERNKQPTFRYASRWASAAVIVLAVSLVFRWNSPNLEGPEAIDKTSPDLTSQVFDARQSRSLNPGLNPGMLKPRVFVSANGPTIESGGVVFQWAEIPGSLYYKVRVVTDEGDMIWQAQVEETEWGLPKHLQLKPGTEYYFRVDAYLASSKSISSQHVLFSIGEQH